MAAIEGDSRRLHMDTSVGGGKILYNCITISYLDHLLVCDYVKECEYEEDAAQ